MNLGENSGVMGIQLITVGAGPVSVAGTDQPCRTCLVMQKSGTQAYMNIGAAATTSHWKLLATDAIEVPVNNVNQINVNGTAGDIVQVLWRD